MTEERGARAMEPGVPSSMTTKEGKPMETTRPVGTSTRNRAKILESPILPGFYGRGLTQKECQSLRAIGIRCSTKWIVVRQVDNIDHLGICYYPSGRRTRFYHHAGVYVETK